MHYGRQIFLATILLCLLIVAAYWFLYHLPLQRDTAQLELQRMQTEQQIVNIINFKNEHGDLDDYMLALETQRTAVEQALPSNLFQGEFLNALQQLALQHQVRLVSIAPGTLESSTKSRVARLPISLSIECSYFELLDFFNAIEDNNRLINIENFSAASLDDGQRLRCELNIVLFALDEEGDNNAEISDGG